MPSTNESKSTAVLEELLNKQNKTLTAALQRISALNDEVSILKSSLNKFKRDVAADVRYLTTKAGE